MTNLSIRAKSIYCGIRQMHRIEIIMLSWHEFLFILYFLLHFYCPIKLLYLTGTNSDLSSIHISIYTEKRSRFSPISFPCVVIKHAKLSDKNYPIIDGQNVRPNKLDNLG